MPRRKNLEELRDFYVCARDYDAVIPFPLRRFVRKALIDAGRTDWACEPQLCGMHKGEAVL